PQVVINLGCRRNRRARIPGRILLLNGDGWSDAVNYVRIRLLYSLQELPCICRERFNIAALALGIDSVEGKGRLARPRNPGHHRQSVMGNLEVDVLQIVDAGAAYNDGFSGHLPGSPQRDRGAPSSWFGSTAESFYYKAGRRANEAPDLHARPRAILIRVYV